MPIWVFEFPKPFGAIDVNFNARLVKRAWVDDYLDTTDGVKNRLMIHVLDGNILRANKMIGLDPRAVELFHASIRKQFEMDYSNVAFNQYLTGIYQYNWKELMQIGKVFKHTKKR